MAEIMVNLRGPIDGLYTKSLVEELEEIGTVEVAYQEEARGGLPSYIPDLAEITKPVVIVTASKTALEASKAVVAAVSRWVREKRSKNEKRERHGVIYGPDGKIIAEVPGAAVREDRRQD